MLVNVVRCTIGTDFLAISSCGFQSDAGQRIYAMHGAEREKGLKGNPQNTFREHFQVVRLLQIQGMRCA